eukprot:CAMPEP_0205823998 /NCGR_PEP_ID=MMETSP0206-20130828/18974_1 /ASSEMBLY_ACC=CAM_ASM_000279 /TAXON_ID=36767 /ORGANISM="Euplotes focardii, Strain TN1" /LENGTH=106 /DNA_ID=CAMNT_0053121711 /DNA_START=8 /DNA_END=328 /DNA_ORIENTATION=+
MEQAIPRVGGDLQAYMGKTVRLVGKVVSTSAQEAVLEACDQKTVRIANANVQIHQASPIVEVVGLVQPDCTIEEYSSTPFGENFDMDKYRQLLTLMNGQYKGLFGL